MTSLVRCAIIATASLRVDGHPLAGQGRTLLERCQPQMHLPFQRKFRREATSFASPAATNIPAKKGMFTPRGRFARSTITNGRRGSGRSNQ